MKKKIKIRLYRWHDIDLITLYKCSSLDIRKTVKKAILSAARGQTYFIKCPIEDIPSYQQTFLMSYSIFLILDDTNREDAEILAFLKGVRDKYQNSVIKAILRNSIVGTAYYTCMKTDTARVLQKALLQDIAQNIKIEPPILKKSANKKNKKKKALPKIIKKDINSNNVGTKNTKDTDENSNIDSDSKISLEQPSNSIEDAQNKENIYESASEEPVSTTPDVNISPETTDNNNTFDFFGNIQNLLSQM